MSDAFAQRLDSVVLGILQERSDPPDSQVEDGTASSFVRGITKTYFTGTPVNFHYDVSTFVWGSVQTAGAKSGYNIMINMKDKRITDNQMLVIAPMIGMNVMYLCSHILYPMAIGVDVSKNKLSDKGILALCSALSHLITLRTARISVFKAYQNGISDQGAAFIAALAVYQGDAHLKEIHLSHNFITNVGASFLTCHEVSKQYTCDKKRRTAPLWLRLENNNISKEFVPNGSWCTATLGECTRKFCKCNAQIHLPFLSV